MRTFPQYSSISFSEDYSTAFLPEIDDLSSINGLADRKLVLLHTGRCGSTLLHYSLAPFICPPYEIFNDVSSDPILKLIPQSLPVSITAYLKAFHEALSQEEDNKVRQTMSISITPWQLLGIHRTCPEAMSWLFEGATVVILTRKNLIKQAISHASSAESKTWHSFDERAATHNLVAEVDSVIRFMDLMLWAEDAIARAPVHDLIASAEQKIKLTYDDLLDNLDTAVRSIVNVVDPSVKQKPDPNNTQLPVKLKRSGAYDALHGTLMHMLPITLPSGVVVTEDLLKERVLA